ncbi:Endopolyphosphatase [Ceratocystis lukuohia]|uniref:Endopolyphosphatase n=1 Tax=Ceratocystis lukuohia TaxID=2019550 RepID=A0ABR4MN82_9PEZI
MQSQSRPRLWPRSRWLQSYITALLLSQQASALAIGKAPQLQHILPLHEAAHKNLQENGAGGSRLHGRFLHITDFHPDMFYKAHTSTAEDIACHRSSGPAGYYGAETSDCDSPVHLVDSVLAWIDENVKDTVDFVIWTGDSARHDSDEDIPRNASQVLGTNKMMVKKITKLFSDDQGKLTIPIIPSLGNNDILPHNILMPAPSEWLRTYTDVWEAFIPESQRHSFEFGGWFYVEVIPNKLAVFSVNTLYLFDRNAGVDDCVNPSEPGFMHMEWLRIQLTQMRARGVKAILTGHVPPARTAGKQNWDETCWQKYNLWLVQFRDVVVGSIYGHMNIDHFLLHDSNDLDILQTDDVLQGTTEEAASQINQDEQDTVHDEAASIYASANYLVDLRRLWSKLPDPSAVINAADSEAEFSASEKRPWKGLGNKHAERYHLSLVSPSIVPNYFPTIRVLSYNTEGLDGPLWRDVENVMIKDDSPDEISTMRLQALENEIEMAKKKMNDKKGKKGKKNKKGKKGPHKDPHLVIPDPPAKGTPPGPGYEMQTLSWLGYVQYYANLTHLNNNIKSSTPEKKKKDKKKPTKGNSVELRSLPETETEVEDDLEFDGEVDQTKWREGPHKNKKLHKNPKHLPFKFDVEYSTFTDKVYKLKDLTVKSYVKLAYRLAKHKPRKGGKALDPLPAETEVEESALEFSESDSAESIYQRMTEVEEEIDEASVDEDDYEDTGSDAGSSALRKGKKSKDKKKKKKKNKVWRQFLEFAFVKTLDKKKIDSLD